MNSRFEHKPKVIFLETLEFLKIPRGEVRIPTDGVRSDHTIYVATGASAGAIEQVTRQQSVFFGERVDSAECSSGSLRLGFVQRPAEIFGPSDGAHLHDSPFAQPVLQ